MNLYRPFVIASMFATLSMIGCDSETDSAVDDGKAISELDVKPEQATLSKGATMQFHAIVKYSEGTTKDVTEDEDTVWNTSDASIATVSEEGLVTAVSEGVVDISAEYKGEKANEHFIVTP